MPGLRDHAASRKETEAHWVWGITSNKRPRWHPGFWPRADSYLSVTSVFRSHKQGVSRRSLCTSKQLFQKSLLWSAIQTIKQCQIHSPLVYRQNHLTIQWWKLTPSLTTTPSRKPLNITFSVILIDCYTSIWRASCQRENQSTRRPGLAWNPRFWAYNCPYITWSVCSPDQTSCETSTG